MGRRGGLLGMGMRRAAFTVALAFVLVPAAAQAGTATSVTMFSDAGDWIGGGQQRLFHPGNGTVAVTGSSSTSVSLDVSGGTHGDSYHLTFAAPAGQTLQAGVYDRAQRAAFREAGRPGIDIGGDGRGCNTIAGRFEVKALSRSSSGAVDRLWIVYEQHCEGGGPALFGEVRFGMPAPDTPALPAPEAVRWPAGDLGRPATVVPVTMIASGATRIEDVSIGGSHPEEFQVRLDECSGVQLGAGQSCKVFMRFAAATAGTRVALLRVADSSGHTSEVALEGFNYGGRTRLEMQSDVGDWVGQGRNWSYSLANARISATGTRNFVSFWIDGDDGSWWSGDFDAPDGDIIAPGTYSNASRYPFNGGGAGIDISGNGRGCNTISGEFTVTEATFRDERLHSFGATFVQHCERGTPALRGTFEWRAGDGVPLAPWMAGGVPAPPPTGGGDEDAGGSASTPATITPTTPTPPAGSGGGSGADLLPQPEEPAGERAGSCTKRAFSPNNILHATRRAERIIGGARDDLIFAQGGNDVVSARGGDDCVLGGSGADRLGGGKGSDVLRGGRGRDVLSGGRGRDVLNCGRGRDVARVTPGDVLRGCERLVDAG